MKKTQIDDLDETTEVSEEEAKKLQGGSKSPSRSSLIGLEQDGVTKTDTVVSGPIPGDKLIGSTTGSGI